MDGNASTFTDHKTSNRNEIFLQYPFIPANETSSLPSMKHLIAIFYNNCTETVPFHETRF